MSNRSYRNAARSAQKNVQRAEKIREKNHRFLARMNAHRVAWVERQKERVRRYREAFGTPGWLGLSLMQRLWAVIASVFQTATFRRSGNVMPRRMLLNRRLVLEGMEQRKLLAGDVFISGKSNTVENLSGNFVISMQTASASDVTVAYSLGGTATQVLDFAPLPGSAVIPAGSTFVNVPISAALDGILEPTETVIMTLYSTSEGSIGSPSSDTILILDGDKGEVRVSVLDGDVSEVGDNSAAFQLSLVDSLSNPLTSTTDTTVTLGIGGSADAGIDYTSISATVVVPAGSSVVSVPFTAINDSNNWDDGETVILSVAGVSTSHPSLTAGSASATITIADPVRPIASVSAVSASVAEDTVATSAEFLVALNSAATDNVTLSLTFGGDATQVDDFTVGGTTTVVISTGLSAATVSFPIVDDGLVEAAETLQLSLSYVGGNVAINSLADSAAVTILDNDEATVSLTGPASVGEADTTLTYAVALSGPTSVPVEVLVQTANDTAAAGSDYVATSQTITIPANTTAAPTATFTVVVNDDTVVEGDETFVVNLSSVVDDNGASVTIGGSNSVTVTIEDNDVATYSVSSPTVLENVGAADFTISITAPAQQNLTFTYAVAGGTAIAGVDFVAPVQTTAVITAGSTAVSVPVTILDNSTVEPDETLSLSISAVSGTTGDLSVGTNPGVMTIDDNDIATINISALVPTIAEPASVAANNNFSLVMTNPSSEPVTVTVSLTGSATAGDDYTAVTTVVFPADQQLASLSVSILPDSIVEASETIIATVIGATGAQPYGTSFVSGTAATMTITDEDSATVTLSLADQTITEGGNANFTLVQSQAASSDTVLSYAVSFTGATATSGDLSGATTGTVTIPSGAISTTFSIATVDDGWSEADETFFINLSKLSGDGSVSLVSTTATVTIEDNDSATISLSGPTAAVEQSGGQTLTYTVALSGPSEVPVTLQVNSSDGSAVASADYNAVSQAIVIPADTAAAPSVTFTVVVNDDTLVEADETFSLALSSVTNGGADISLGSVSAVDVTIQDDDSAELVISGGGTVSEGAGTMVFTLSLDQPSTVDTVVQFSRQNGPVPSATGANTLTASADYVVQNNQNITFVAGDTVKYVTVDIVDDVVDEANEMFRGRAEVTNANGASVTEGGTVVAGRSVATVTIADNDAATVAISGPASVTEGGADPTFTITSGPSSADVTVYYETVNGSATTLDYTPVTSSVVFPGNASATVVNTFTFAVAVADDGLIEGDETFSVSLTSVTGGNSPVVGVSAATVTIEDNDTVGVDVSASTPSVNEGPATSATFAIALTTTAEEDVTVSYSTVDGSATVGSDYTGTNGSVVITAGQSTATVVVPIVENTVAEGNETFALSITATSSAAVTVGTGSANVTIVDNDVATATVAKIVDAAETTVGPIGVTGRFRITLSNPVDQPTTITFNALAGSASEGVDYQAVGTEAIIPAGQTTVNVDIVPNNDTILEGAESVILQLSGASASSSPSLAFSATPATLTIFDNDTSALSVTGASVSETGGPSTSFVLSLSSLTATDVTISYSLSGSATSGSDYTDDSATTGVAVIPAGTLTVAVPLSIIDNTIVEPSESLVLNVDSINAGTVTVTGAGNTATVTIADDDQAAAQIIALMPSVGEASNAGYLVYLDNAAQYDTTVTVNLSGDAQPSGVDYLGSATQSVVIPAGSLSASLSITVVDDSLVEDDETLIATVGGVSGQGSFTVGVANSSTVTIEDNDSASVTIQASAAVSEGNAATTDVVLTIALSNPSAFATAVTYSTAPGTAADGSDYVGVTNAVANISAGDTQALITLSVNGDTMVENDETFAVTLTGVSSVPTLPISLGGADTAVVTIQNDDAATVSIQATESVTEGDAGSTPVSLTISLSAPSQEDTTVTFSTADGSATVADSDYSGVTTATAVISAGLTETVVVVNVTGDEQLEGDETFTVALSSVVSGLASITVGSADEAVVTIGDDDAAQVSVVNPNATVTEGGNVVFTLTQDAVSATDTVINYSFQPGVGAGGAVAGDTSGVVTSSVTIAAGDTSALITIGTNDDTIVELDETFTLNLSKGSGDPEVTLATSTVTATIVDNDESFLRIFASNSAFTQSVSEGIGETGLFFLSLTSESSTPTTVAYSIGGDALNGTDYGTIPTTAVIPASATTLPITISLVDDNVVENTEVIELSLVNTSNPAVVINLSLNDVASTSILDNDGTATLSVTPTAATVVEGAPSGFLIELSGPTGLDTTIVYDLVPSASLTTEDYLGVTVGTGLTTVIPAGDTSALITFGTADDTLLESDEQMSLVLNSTLTSGVSNLSVDATPAVVTIQDNDVASMAVVALQNAVEGGQNGLFRIEITKPADTDTVISYSINDPASTADETLDFAPLSGTATIPAFAQFVELPIAAVNDTLVEGNESVVVTLETILSGDAQISLVPSMNDEASLTIIDNDTTTLSIGNAAVTEGAGDATLVVSLNNPATTPIEVAFVVNADSAQAGDDYTTPVTLTASFGIGATTANIVIPIVDDSVVEDLESFTVSLTSANSPAVLLPGTEGTVTITDDDSSTASILSGAAATEGAPLTFTVSLSELVDAPTTLTYAISGGNATATADYDVPSSFEVVIPANTPTATFSIQTAGDSFVEGDETIQVELTGVSGDLAAAVTPDMTPVTGVVEDDDATTASITATTPAAAEGGADGVFQVSLTGASDKDRTVHYTVSGGATNSLDYTLIPGSVVVPSGTTVAEITIAVADDSENELSEDVVLTLNSVSTDSDPTLALATISPTPATVTIADNDLRKLSVSFSGSTVDEGDATVVTLSLDQFANQDFTVVVTFAGDADLSDDFVTPVASPQLVTFTVGQSTATITLDVADDSFVEGDEILSVSLGTITAINTINQTLPAVVDVAAASVTLIDGDQAFLSVVKQQDAIDPEGIGPAQVGIFWIQLTQPSQTDTVISYTVGGDADSGDDFTALPGLVTITAGQTQAFITVANVNDNIVEDDETVALSLDSITSGNMAIQFGLNTSATLTISDEDIAEISVASVPSSVTEGDSGVFRIALTKPADTITEVTLTNLPSGTATLVDDYSGLGASTVVQIPAGSLSVDVTISTVGDTLAEADETVVVDVDSTPASYGGRITASSVEATLTIEDNDPLVVEQVVINGGAVQRSLVTEMEVTLNGVVVDTPANRAEFSVFNRQSLNAVGLNFVFDYSTAGKTKIKLTFSGPQTEFGSLVNGNYQLNISSGLTYAGGTLGSAFSYGNASGHGFYRWYGDLNGNRVVDLTDLTAFSAAFGKTNIQPGYNAAFDFNLNNVIDLDELTKFASNFGQTLNFA